jgi:hypothetical protein
MADAADTPSAGSDERGAAALTRVEELFTSLVERAVEVSVARCPYKNRLDQCTAEFGCRNQRPPRSEGERKVCAGDDKLDYRSAWETE